jgi:uncharacterized membrane protein
MDVQESQGASSEPRKARSIHEMSRPSSQRPEKGEGTRSAAEAHPLPRDWTTPGEECSLSWSRRYAISSYIRSALWIAPVLALALEQATFRIAAAQQLDWGSIPGFVYGREGALALADYVITSSTAFIVFTFGSMIVAIQVAGGQSSPRIIATMLLRDDAIRWAVGLFAYVLLLAVAIKTRIDTIPQSLVSILGLLALTSIIVFLFLIDHAARLLRPVTIVSRIADDGLKVIEDVYPNAVTTASVDVPSHRQASPQSTVYHRGKSAVVIAVNLKALMTAAKNADAVIEMVPRVGDFVATNDPLFRVHRARAALDERLLYGNVAFGRERTLEQDSTFAFRVIVDIAIKALSSAINDPTTAVIAIDQLQPLLRTVGMRDLRNDWLCDENGRRRVFCGTPDWDDFVQLTFSEIRHLGAGNIQVARRVRAMIESVTESLPESRRPALRRELDLLDRAVQQQYPFPEDQALARTPDPQGLGGASDHEDRSFAD